MDRKMQTDRRHSLNAVLHHLVQNIGKIQRTTPKLESLFIHTAFQPTMAFFKFCCFHSEFCCFHSEFCCFHSEEFPLPLL